MKSGMGKLLTFIMAAFLLVFAGYHAYRHFFSGYTTENVYRYTVYHSTTAQGVFFREEKSLDQSAGSNLRYAVRDGEKVRVGSVLAYRYRDALSADLAERRAEAQKELTMLQRVLAQLQSSNTPTVSDLTRNTDIDLQKLAEAVALEHYSGMDTLALNLQEEINLGSGITGKTAALEARIAELEAQTSGSASGEAVYSTLEWYFALTISSKEHKNYQLGSRVNLAFAGGGTAQGTVVRTELSDDGSAMMLVIRGDAVTEDTVSRRAATVRLSSENYTGVRFDKEYLRIVDGVKGVYVDNGYSVKFKTVDIIYEGDTYYLSRLNYTGEEQLNIFDKLIASKTELYDGMPLSDL